MNDTGWRRTLRREISWLLALKVAALALLWWLFFSPVHRTAVEAQAESRRLALTGATAFEAVPAPASRENRRD